MLVFLDVLIGVTVIMLGFSLVITVANQIISTLLALRGRNLRWGLSVLIQELHSDHFTVPSGLRVFGADLNPQAKKLAGDILSHRLISDSKFPATAWKLASAIRFEEFLKIVDLLGASGDVNWLRKNNRITESWFNTIMDRVSQRFTMHMRIYTLVFAAIVVFWTGMDTLHIVAVLRNDANLRSGLVTTADSISKQPLIDFQDQTKLRDMTRSVINQLPKDQSLTSLIYSGVWNPLGMLLSIVLLSLGAPFWFNALKNLVNLRSSVAKKEETERTAPAPLPPDTRGQIRWEEAHV